MNSWWKGRVRPIASPPLLFCCLRMQPRALQSDLPASKPKNFYCLPITQMGVIFYSRKKKIDCDGHHIVVVTLWAYKDAQTHPPVYFKRGVYCASIMPQQGSRRFRNFCNGFHDFQDKIGFLYNVLCKAPSFFLSFSPLLLNGKFFVWRAGFSQPIGRQCLMQSLIQRYSIINGEGAENH